MSKDKGYVIILLQIALVIIMTLLSVISESFSFILEGFILCLLIFIISSSLQSERRLLFNRVVISVFFLYVVFILLSILIFIHNPLIDFYVDRDECKYLKFASDLSNLSYGSIWNTTFTRFKYSDSPFYLAMIGTLQKAANLSPIYSLVFQKIISAFLGSISAGMVYLISFKIIDNDIRSYKAALAYGCFSFLLFYSVGMLRDVHMALLYSIGIYIIIGNNYSFKNYMSLAIIGIIAYYIRVENGLFFISFIGVWAFNKGGRYKFFIALVTLCVMVIGLFLAGGVGGIAKRAMSTTDVYEARAHAAYDNTGSIGVKLNQLPIPLNYIAKAIWGQATPFPFWYYLDRGETFLQKIFYLPQAIPGLLWFIVWYRILSNFKRTIEFFKKYKWVAILTLLYIVVVSTTQPNPRRLFYIYPFIFAWYVYIDNRLLRSKDLRVAIPLYIGLIILYLGIKF